jgi:NAD(P)-dependent dehydrogenase (short-subunit alcohol dehydrogenase family)
MRYFVTGGTGFIGRFLVERLLARGGTVFVLVRSGSEEKLEALRERLHAPRGRILAVPGDLENPDLASEQSIAELKGTIDHAFHLAAVYDMSMDDETADRVNVEGTKNVVRFVNRIAGPVRLHHVSSVAVAGADFHGTFTEAMFEEGQQLGHPYYRTKFESERIVRDEAKVPFRIYRPGMVVGSSETGEMDKVDGPYYLFKRIKTIRDRVPKWLPILGIDGGHMPIAPVDYVASAIDTIAHKEGWDGKAFFLLQKPEPTVGEMLSTFLKAAHGPDIAAKLNLNSVPALSQARSLLGSLPLSDAVQRQISSAIGIPLSIFGYVVNRARFDDSNARAALAGSGIECPKLDTYADKLWTYWEMHLHHDYKVTRRAVAKLAGKVVVVTGASSGIGSALAKKLAIAGAKVVLVARTRERLEETRDALAAMGGDAYVFPCDLTDMEAIDKCVDAILAELGAVDVLVNNAGRSIRRSVWESLERFHDFERTMQLNYFGAVRMITRLLPSMGERKAGHIINVSSVGCLANVPRFSAYVASKAALDAFSRCLSAEVRGHNIELTTVYMPLVRTPMIAPTKIYNYFPTITPEAAADLVVKAMVDRPKRVSTALGVTAEVSYALWPKVNDYILNIGFQMFPSSAAARGKRDGEAAQPRDGEAQADVRPSREGIAFANLFRGLHW